MSFGGLSAGSETSMPPVNTAFGYTPAHTARQSDAA